jgi:hypothetical protein
MHLAKARIRRPSRARDNGCFGPLVTGGLRHPAIFRRPCLGLEWLSHPFRATADNAAAEPLGKPRLELVNLFNANGNNSRLTNRRPSRHLAKGLRLQPRHDQLSNRYDTGLTAMEMGKRLSETESALVQGLHRSTFDAKGARCQCQSEPGSSR